MTPAGLARRNLSMGPSDWPPDIAFTDPSSCRQGSHRVFEFMGA